MNDHNIMRGDIFYVEKCGSTTGSEQDAGRPAVIVSNKKNNQHSGTVEIVYCTTKPKAVLPTHCTIYTTKVASTVLCEQITTVDKKRLGDYIGTCTDEEMARIDAAICISLGFDEESKQQCNPFLREKSVILTERQMTEEQLALVRCERDTYKNLYEALLNKLLPTAAGKE